MVLLEVDFILLQSLGLGHPNPIVDFVRDAKFIKPDLSSLLVQNYCGPKLKLGFSQYVKSSKYLTGKSEPNEAHGPGNFILLRCI